MSNKPPMSDARVLHAYYYEQIKRDKKRNSRKSRKKPEGK